MTLLADWQIRNLCLPVAYDGPEDKPIYGYQCPQTHKRHAFTLPMIEPFTDYGDRPGKLSYGLNHYGYDLRLGRELKVFKSTFGEILDPKMLRDPDYEKRMFDTIVYGEDVNSFILHPHCCVLGTSFEYLRIPRFLQADCLGKSTIARVAVQPLVTPLEPDWEGNLTIELVNHANSPVRVHFMEGICQIRFHVGDAIPERSYKDKGGIYQNQRGVTVSRIKE